MISVISHRGYWKSPDEKNTAQAFHRSFSLGFGTETDVRDSLRDGVPKLVISHDVPTGHEMLFEEMLEIACANGKPLLALNIKCDGLYDILLKSLMSFDYDNYFTFDASVPDLIQGEKRGAKCYTRLSEYEAHASLYDAPNVIGVWVDLFLPGRWYSDVAINRLLDDGKQVALVAPDLHRRHEELEPFLEWIKSTNLVNRSGLTICTDEPERVASCLGLHKD